MSETTNLKLFKHDNPATNTNQFDVDKALNENLDKIDEFAGQANNKVIEIEDTIEENQNENNKQIEELKEENKRLREDLNNSTITASSSGEDITITDSIEARFKKLVVGGNSWQETSEQGKNYYDENAPFNYAGNIESTTVKNDDGTYTNMPSPEHISPKKNCGSNINLFDGELELGSLGNNTGQPSINSNIVRSKNFKLVKPNSTYTLSNNMNYANYIYEYDENQNFVKLTVNKAANTVVASNNTKYIKFRSTATDTVYENDLNVKYKLEEGAIATPYTPYNCGSIDTKITGRNVFNINSDEFGVSSLVTKKDDTITLKDMYNVKIAGNDFVVKTFKPNTTYTCKAKVKVTDRINIVLNNDFVKYVFIRIAKEGAPSVSILKDDNKANFELNKEYNVKTVFTTPEDLAGFQIYGFTFSGKETEDSPEIRKGTIEFRDFIIYEGTDDVPYEPYQEQLFSFPLEKGQVLHKRDYLADDGIRHKRKTYIFNGTEEFTYHRTANNIVGWRFTQLTDSEPLEDLMCTHFKNTTQNIYYNDKREYGMVATANKTETTFKHYIYFTQPNEEINTIDKLKAFLTEQAEKGTPVKLEYDLREEEIEPYTPEQQEAYNKIKNAKTYKGITRIYSEDEISPIFEVETFSNAQVEHDKLQKQIDEIKTLLSSTETSAMLVDNLEKDVKKEVEEIC